MKSNNTSATAAAAKKLPRAPRKKLTRMEFMRNAAIITATFFVLGLLWNATARPGGWQASGFPMLDFIADNVLKLGLGFMFIALFSRLVAFLALFGVFIWAWTQF